VFALPASFVTLGFHLFVTTGAAMHFPRKRCSQCADDLGGGSAADSSDRELLRAYQSAPAADAGRRAVALLLGRYRRRVLVWCRRLIRDADRAEDLAHDSLLAALRSLDRYQEQGEFGAWLFMITRRRCLSELRRRRLPLADEAVLELISDSAARPDEDLERKGLGADLERLLRENLDPLEQDAVWLRCYEGLSVNVITQRLAITESSGARAVLQRARRKLRRALAMREEETP
jgi:RNA polymerase sigma-70 factor (ECF subfamily)